MDTSERDSIVIRDRCIAALQTWVAEVGGQGAPTVVAMMVLGEASLDQLYVQPGWQGEGIGSRLLALAKDRRPNGFELYAFQVNKRACRFYRRRGLVLVDTSDGLRNEDGEPDARYRSLPAATSSSASAPVDRR